jgi:MOSC domain-containing protein YiiM
MTESFCPETLAADFYPCSPVSSVVKLNPVTGNCMIRVCHLFTSPGHNFVGHHGGPPGEHAVVESDEVECVVGRGIRGDRYFDFKENYKGQVTFFSLEVFDAMRRELNLPEARPALTRRNIFVSGTDLLSLVGQEFEIQGVRFHGVEECRPCYWMNQAFGNERAESWLKGRGGLRARILTGGVLRRDAVT